MVFRVLGVVAAAPLIFVVAYFPGEPDDGDSAVQDLCLGNRRMALSLGRYLERRVAGLFVPFINADFTADGLRMLISAV